MSAKLRKDMDDVSEKTGTSLQSCRRQVDEFVIYWSPTHLDVYFWGKTESQYSDFVFICKIKSFAFFFLVYFLPKYTGIACRY